MLKLDFILVDRPEIGSKIKPFLKSKVCLPLLGKPSECNVPLVCEDTMAGSQ